jgi:hypothetical protein
MSEVRSSWIKAHGEEAIAMAKAGHSFAEIAKWLEGKRYFVTRNAVGGYMHRIGVHVGPRGRGPAASKPQSGLLRWHVAHGQHIIGAYLSGTKAPELVVWLGARGYDVNERAVRSFLAREGVKLAPEVAQARSDRSGVVQAPWVLACGDQVLEMARTGATHAAVKAWLEGQGFQPSSSTLCSFVERHGLRFRRRLPKSVKTGLPLVVPMKDSTLTARPGEPAPVTTLLGRRRDQCGWIVSGADGSPARGDDPCCGAPVVPGTSWCKAHHARVFTPFSAPVRRKAGAA